MNDFRQTVFARIREALHHPRNSRSITARVSSGPPSTEALRACLPSIGKKDDALLNTFREQCALLETELILCSQKNEIPSILANLARKHNWQRAASHDGQLTSPVFGNLPPPVLNTSTGYPLHDLESCDVGITECEALIAQTGSTLLSSKASGGRSLSTLVPHHVILATQEQLVPDLVATFNLLLKRYPTGLPGMLTLHTSPNHATDIVAPPSILATHSPKKRTLILVTTP